jgi:DNA (cytosine-5)-methyltransferase 1
VAAVELDRDAAATYKANHPDTILIEQDIRAVKGAMLAKASPTGRIDLIAGCPPCQGFSSLTAKYRKDDPRNGLVSQMERLVDELKPAAVMMENVPGLAMKGKRRLNRFKARLVELGYTVNCEVLQVANFGVPQRRRRLVLLAGKGFSIELPKPTHSRLGEKGLKSWVNVGAVLKGLPRPVTLNESWEAGKGPKEFNWNIVRTLSDENVRRLRKARVGRGWVSIAKRLRPTCHQNRKAGFSNVYGRMRWIEPSPTITGGCTTFSKGRFGHPDQLRTISVREAALLQTFPKDYIIQTDYMEAACNIIGNALPCTFASVVALQCEAALEADARKT